MALEIEALFGEEYQLAKVGISKDKKQEQEIYYRGKEAKRHRDHRVKKVIVNLDILGIRRC